MIYNTKNDTTVKVGQAQATVICDSIANGNRICTFELLYPRYIHSELMTHRMFSRNASSSRATPIKVLADEVMHDPVFFDVVGVNKAGMQSGHHLTDEELSGFKASWDKLADDVAQWVIEMQSKYNIHKQVLNRVLEPFSRIRVLVTATEWDNFFKLRLAPDAQPEMQSLALAMKTAMAKSKPVERTEHVPYSTDDDLDRDIKIKVSVARCARVSYGRLEEKLSSVQDDLNLYDRLVHGGHLSPFEHVAFAADSDHHNRFYANFRGWRSYRFEMFKR